MTDKSPRETGDQVEDYVNEILNLIPTTNSGGSDRKGNSLGYDHAHPRFVGESKYKGNDKRPNITTAEYKKLIRRAEQEGYKDWIFFVQYDGNKRAVMLDLDVFAELTYSYWREGKDEKEI